MIAAISENNPDTAEWFFLIATILFVVAAVVSFVRYNRPVVVDDSHHGLPGWFEHVLVDIGLAFVAAAFLVL